MNEKLTNTIVEHIFNNLGIINQNLIKNSIINDAFKIDQKINYFNENNEDKIANVYCCETTVNKSKFYLMATIFDDDLFLISKLEDCPAYGCFGSIENKELKDSFIVCNLGDKSWIPTTIFIKATFLAGMEQLREVNRPFLRSESYNDYFKLLKEFIDYCYER